MPGPDFRNSETRANVIPYKTLAVDFEKAYELKLALSWLARIFGVSDDSVPERRRMEREKRFEPLIPAAVSLAPLVWNTRRARSMGNRLFPARNSE